jgi:hypothetical protein
VNVVKCLTDELEDGNLNIENLLNEVKSIRDRHELIMQEQHIRFNIFEIDGFAKSEVLFCRFIAKLISPARRSGWNFVFLKSFLK